MKFLIISNHSRLALVDDEDYIKVKDWSWCYSSPGSIQGTINGISISLHKFLYPHKTNLLIDHKDRDCFNNQKSNFRLCTNSQNQMNRCKGFTYNGKQTSSKFKGVYKHNEKFTARISINGRRIHIGTYSTEVEAAIVYNEYALKYYKEFAKLNII